MQGTFIINEFAGLGWALRRTAIMDRGYTFSAATLNGGHMCREGSETPPLRVDNAVAASLKMPSGKKPDGVLVLEGASA